MTRWARAGNTQRHRKQPEDATPWEEFCSQSQLLTKTQQKKIKREKDNHDRNEMCAYKKALVDQDDDKLYFIDNGKQEANLESVNEIDNTEESVKTLKKIKKQKKKQLFEGADETSSVIVEKKNTHLEYSEANANKPKKTYWKKERKHKESKEGGQDDDKLYFIDTGKQEANLESMNEIGNIEESMRTLKDVKKQKRQLFEDGYETFNVIVEEQNTYLEHSKANDNKPKKKYWKKERKHKESKEGGQDDDMLYFIDTGKQEANLESMNGIGNIEESMRTLKKVKKQKRQYFEEGGETFNVIVDEQNTHLEHFEANAKESKRKYWKDERIHKESEEGGQDDRLYFTDAGKQEQNLKSVNERGNVEEPAKTLKKVKKQNKHQLFEEEGETSNVVVGEQNTHLEHPKANAKELKKKYGKNERKHRVSESRQSCDDNFVKKSNICYDAEGRNADGAIFVTNGDDKLNMNFESADEFRITDRRYSRNNRRNWNPPNHKETFMEQVRKRRLENGILLLPPSIEQKLYRMKRDLRERGATGDQIKQIIRQVRRREEIKYRRTLKICYNCRKFGHILSQCPLIAADTEQGTGICFKCGSTEHTSHQCHVKTDDFKFAKCFICHEQGHISRHCPQNTHGAYPKGGNCNLCGNIDHLKKDCPMLKKKSADDEITADVISTHASVDHETVETQTRNPSSSTSNHKKLKVVKF